MYCSDASGELVVDFEGGHNEWLTHEAFAFKEKVFESAIDFMAMIEAGEAYRSQEYKYDSSEY